MSPIETPIVRARPLDAVVVAEDPITGPPPAFTPVARRVSEDAAGSEDAQQVLQESGYPLGARLAMVVSRGVGLILISRALGPVDFGTYSLVLATFAIAASLGTFGMDQSHVYHANAGRRRAATLVRNALWLAAALGALTASALLGVTHLLRGQI